MKNHSYNLYAPICGIFCLHSVDVARYAALIQTKSPTNCDAHLAESIFRTRSKKMYFTKCGFSAFFVIFCAIIKMIFLEETYNARFCK